jgi:hypothetical protein
VSDELKARAEAIRKVVSEHPGTVATRRFYQFTAGLDAITLWVKYVFRFFWGPMSFVRRWYGYLWDEVVYDADGKFSKRRAGAMIIVSVAFTWFLAVPIVMFFFHVGIYVLTHRTETAYLFNAQEIDPGSNVHSVQGCHALPCSDSESIYYRIEANAFNEVWSLVNGHGFFFADYVAAAVPVTVSKCEITTYGFRMKLFMRGTDVYPYLLASSCTPLNSQRVPA